MVESLFSRILLLPQCMCVWVMCINIRILFFILYWNENYTTKHVISLKCLNHHRWFAITDTEIITLQKYIVCKPCWRRISIVLVDLTPVNARIFFFRVKTRINYRSLFVYTDFYKRWQRIKHVEQKRIGIQVMKCELAPKFKVYVILIVGF